MATVKKTAFGSAFAAARAKGDRTFEFGGKKYTTALQGESGKKTVSSLAKNYEKSTGLPRQIEKMEPKAVSTAETAAMPKRETQAFSPSTSSGNMFTRAEAKMDARLNKKADMYSAPMANANLDKADRLRAKAKETGFLGKVGEFIKKRQLARAERLSQRGSSPSTPPPSAPQTESGQGLSTVGKAMLSNYLSRKKYMGGGKMEYGMGGKMKKYAKGGKLTAKKNTFPYTPPQKPASGKAEPVSLIGSTMGAGPMFRPIGRALEPNKGQPKGKGLYQELYKEEDQNRYTPATGRTTGIGKSFKKSPSSGIPKPKPSSSKGSQSVEWKGPKRGSSLRDVLLRAAAKEFAETKDSTLSGRERLLRARGTRALLKTAAENAAFPERLSKKSTEESKSYAKGGMIEKEGMKPKGKMDKKKAFLEMIAKLKAKKK